MLLQEPDVYDYEGDWTPPTVTCERLACPHLGDREIAFLFRPESYSDWRRDLSNVIGQRPRCILFGLPERHDNLTLDDLRQWVCDAQMRAPEIPIFLHQPGAACPCGERAACLHCPQTAARLLQEQITDWTERGIPSFDQLKSMFPTLTSVQQNVLAHWALSASKKNPNHAITLKELADNFKVTPRTIERWRDHARTLHPELMHRLETYRALRARKTGRYSMRE